MTRRRVLPWKALLTLGFLSLFVGCQDDKPKLVEIEFNPQLLIVPNVICIKAGEAAQLWVHFEDGQGIPVPFPPGHAVTWESSNPAVAQVTEDGRVLAMAEGQANITASCKGYRATAMVRVSDPCGDGE